MVIADEKATDTYYSGIQVSLLPEMCSTDITMDMIAAGQNHLLLPGCRAFEETEESDRNLTSCRAAERKDVLPEGADRSDHAVDREEGDEQGPFPWRWKPGG